MDHSRDIIRAGGFSHRGAETREAAFYVCATCGPVEPYHVKLTGRWLRQPCQCQIAEQQRRYTAELKLARLRDLARITYDWLGDGRDDMPLVEKTFETFQAYRQQEAFDMAGAFCLDMEAHAFILHGTYGTGKTHLLAAICNELRLQNKLSRFTTAPKLFRVISERIGRNEDYTRIVRAAITTPLFVMDDIDKAKPTEWKEEIYYEIIDERTKHGRPIALSTNKLTDLAHYIGGAACSRLSIGQIAVEMSGDDFRMEM